MQVTICVYSFVAFGVIQLFVNSTIVSIVFVFKLTLKVINSA